MKLWKTNLFLEILIIQELIYTSSISGHEELGAHMFHDKSFRNFLLLPLVSLVILAPLLLALGFKTAAYIVGYAGPLVVLAVAMLFIVFVDSKKRWPKANAFTRYSRVITFYRD